MQQNYDSAFRVSPGGYSTDLLTQDACKQLCTNFQFPFAGLMFGEYCLCSNHTGDLEEVDSSFCDKHCMAVTGEICGSNNIDLIYVMEAGLMGTVDSIEITFADEYFYVDKAVKIIFQVEASTAYAIYVQFGDGTSHKLLSEPYEIEKFYRIPGEYTIFASAIDITELNQAATTEVTIQVEDKMMNFDIVCPDVVEPKTTFECRVTFISGTYNLMSYQMSKGSDQSEELEILDPFYTVIGHQVPYIVNEMNEHFSINEQEVYLSYVKIRFKSHLIGFEFLAKEKGSIQIMVLNPVCASGSYCEGISDCSSTCSPDSVRSCSEEEALCSLSSQCVISDSPPECAIKPTSDYEYEVKHSFDVTIGSEGYNYYDVPEKEKYIVLPGDVIGFKTDGSSALWCRNSTDWEKALGIQDRSPNAGLGVQHFLKAVIVEAVNTSLRYIYNETGNQTVTVSVSRMESVEPVTKTTYLPVQIPISGASIEMIQSNALMGKDVSLKINTINGTDLIVTWEYFLKVEEEKFPGFPPDEGYVKTITCELSGKQIIIANISNLWNSEVVSAEFYCLGGISRDWLLTSDSPKSIPPGILTFNLKFVGTTLPSSAVFISDFGDDTSHNATVISSDSNAWETSFSHVYEKGGSYNVSVNISILANFEIFEITVYIKEKLHNLTVIPWIGIPGMYPSGRTQLMGPGMTGAPLMSTIYFEATVLGQATKFIMNSDDPSLQQVSEKNIFSHTFMSFGEYNITFKAYDSETDEYSNEFLLLIQIMSKISEVNFTASSLAVTTNDVVEFTILVKDMDAMSCVMFKSGDISNNLAFGNEFVCNSKYMDVSLYRFIPKPSTSFRKKRDVQKAEWIDDKTISINYQYMYGGEYIASVDVFNPISMVSEMLTLAVAEVAFQEPLVWMLENSTNINKPIKMQKGNNFRFEAISVFRNNATYIASHLWTACKVDQMGNEIEEIDLTPLKTYNSSTLVVVKQFLDIGKYKLKYTLTVYEEQLKPAQDKNEEIEIYDDYYSRSINNQLHKEEEEFYINYQNLTILASKTIYTYLEVIATPLVPSIIYGGASYVRRGFNQSIWLEPTVYTIDPDFPENGVYNVTWFCSRFDTGEKLVKLDEYKYDMSNPSAPITDRSTINEGDNKGGCFGKGPGLMAIGTGDYKLECNTLWGFDATYDIVAVISKDGKVAECRLLVEVIEKNPPSLKIMCEKGKACFPQVWGQFVNPNSFIRIKAECLDNCGDAGEMRYEWKMYSSDIKNFKKDPIEWESHIQSDKERMGINQTLFASNPNIKVFLVEVTGILLDPNVPNGVSFMFLIINDPPASGDCKISHTFGRALLDTFDIEFTGWQDKDGHLIADYSVYVKYRDEMMRFSHGMITKIEVVLPYGDLEIWCSIQDQLGATTMFSAANFSTSLPTEEEFAEYEKLRIFEKCLAEGKKSMASQIVIAKSSVILEYKKHSNQSGDFDGVSDAEVNNVWNEYLVQDGIDSSYFTVQAKDEVLEILTEKLEKQMDEDAKKKNKELSKLLDLPIESLEDAEIFGGALAAIAENGPSDLNAKLKLIQGLEKIFDIVNKTDVTHPEELEVVLSQFGSLANSVAGSFADSNMGGKFLPKELKRAQEVLDHNATEPNYFLLYVEGNRKEIQDKLYERAVDAAVSSQSDDAKLFVSEIQDMISDIQQKNIEALLVGPDPFLVKSKSGFQMTLIKNYASNMSESVIQQGDSSISLPDICPFLGTENCEDVAIGVQAVRWTRPLQSHGEGSEKLSDKSNVIQVELTPSNGSFIIPIQNSSEPFIICIPDSGSSNSTKNLEHIIPKFSQASDILVYHTTFIDAAGVAAIVNIIPENPEAPLVLFFKYGERPSLTDYDGIMKVSDIPVVNGMHNLFIGSGYITEPGQNLSVAVGHFSNDTKVENFFKNPDGYNLTHSNMTNKFTSTYSIALSLTGCYYFDEEEEKWSTEGCKVSSYESSATCCKCNHLSSFGSGLFVAPNKIDFAYVFANAGFNTNKTIYATLIVILSVFILLLIFAHWKDRKDVEKLGASPLPDNEASDKYVYEILVFTGHQRTAGTKSNVFFIASGEDDETEVRLLADDKRPVLQNGSIDVFVMSVPRSLGQLNYLRIWHDNSGTGRWSSWFCQYIVFRDVQTGLKYEFLVDRWFGVEHDDGLIDRLIPVAGKEQVTEFSHLFSANSRRNLADSHLWFSVFLRPPRSRFTRVQRVSCCMAVMCLSMLTNAMYYERIPDKPASGGFKFGPLSVTPEQIVVGLISNFIIFPPTFIMIFFFRKSRPRKLRPSHIELALKNQKEEWKKNNPEEPIPVSEQTAPTDEEAQMHRKKKKFSLPWWCVFFGWFFVIASIGSSLFFIWAYAIQFGDEKTSKWLTSLVIAFFSSVLLTQPIKIILLAIIVSCLCRSNDYDQDDADEDEEDPHLQPDETFLHDGPKRSRTITYRPMDLEALEEARKEREKEIKMYGTIREVSAYFFFLWIVMILSFGNRDPSNFYLRQALINGFIKPGDLWVEYNNVNTEKRFWNWTYNALIPELFAYPWYNGKDPLGLRLYLDDRNNLKISYGVMRQVRIKPRSCKVLWLLEDITPECAGFGSMVFEDGTLYTKGWRPVNSSDTLVPPEYKYLSASQLKGYPFWGQIDWYGGGGYVVPLVSRRDSDVTELFKKLQRLERDGWIDRHTRAVFVEFGVYNAQVNLFCSVTIVAEFLPGGGIIPYYHVDPVRLLNYHTGFGLFQMIVEIAFIIFTVYFTYREFKNISKQKFAYFSDTWNIAELVSLIVSYTGIVNQIYKLFMTAEILRIFNETEGTGYVKLQEAVLLNDLLCYQIGLIMSIATLKFLKLLRFNRRIGMLSSTLKMCAHELKSFGVCLMVVFLAFVILFWLLLGRQVREFSTFVYSFESSISMMLKKFKYEDMYAAQPILTPIAFFAFSLATALVLVNILLSIIIHSFEDVKHDESLQSNEYEIFDFFINWLKMTLGCGTAKVRPLPPSMYRDKKPPKDTVSAFPDKVDRLVDFINDFYFENQMDFNSIDFLKKMNAETDEAKKKTKPVKVSKSNVPKIVSERFDDF